MESDILHSVAEVAIGLAGFGGIAAGLGYRAKGEWSEADRVRLFVLISLSLAVVFACYVPFAIDELSPSPPWRVAALGFLPVPVTYLIGGVWISRRGTASAYNPARLALACASPGDHRQPALPP